MAADPVSKLRRIRARGVKILQELVNGPGAIEAERAWVVGLLTAVEPWGEAEQGRYEPLGTITPDEHLFALQHVAAANSEDKAHLDSLYCHAVRVFRLEELFNRIREAAAAKPKGKGGRKKIDDALIIAKVYEIMATQKQPNKSKALTLAIEHFNLSKEEADKAWGRIYKSKI